MADDLTGKVAVVTGGGTGIGRATSIALAGCGVNIAVNYSKSQGDAETTVLDLRALGVQAHAIKADVSVQSEVQQMFSTVSEVLGDPSILINNAGITRFIPYDEMAAVTDQVWQDILGVNVIGAFNCAREAVGRMSDGGVIINVASTSGITGLGSSIPYATSKAALIGLTKALARSLSPSIRVNAVAPGVVTTRWVDGQEDFITTHAQTNPMGRNATASDVAEVILSLVTSARFVTGQTVVIDGGKTI